LDIQAGVNKLRTEPVYGDQPDRKGGKVTKATALACLRAPTPQRGIANTIAIFLIASGAYSTRAAATFDQVNSSFRPSDTLIVAPSAVLVLEEARQKVRGAGVKGN
jgi:hypothetical protein